MLAGAPLIAYALLVTGFVRRGTEWRTATLHAATMWGALVVCITEGLGRPGWLTREGLAGAWLAVDAGLVLFAGRRARGADGPLLRDRLRTGLRRLGLVDAGLLAGTGAMVTLVGLTALLSPPNTWDVMQYHLPRVVHWIQNRDVALYPTHELKQLHMAPGAEYVVLQFHALWGGDRLDNLAQWFAMLGAAVGVSLLARSLGAGVRGQVLAAVACATIPEGILAASGAKNDYVLSFWLVAMAGYGLRFAEQPRWPAAAGVGTTLGLALLTKGTAWVLAPPILVTFWVFWPARVKAAFLKQSPLVVLLAASLNAGHLADNYRLYGTPLGPTAEDPAGTMKYTNDAVTGPILVSNALRNAALHVRGRHRATNAVTETWIGRIVRAAGADPDDPRTNFFSFTPFQLPEYGLHEGFAGNPAHLALFAVTLGVVLVGGARADRRRLAVYVIALVLSYAAFSGLLRWQSTGARLQLPLFVLLSAAVGAAIRPRWVAAGAAIALLGLAAPAVMGNEARSLAADGKFPVIGADRSRAYFGGRPGVAADYLAAAAYARRSGCRAIGLELSSAVGEQYEYPWLALLDAGRGARIEAVGVSNASRAYSRPGRPFEPCLVICVLCERIADLWARSGGPGAHAAVFGDVVVFHPGRR